MVFNYEKAAVDLMQSKKDYKEVVEKLAKADQLLAQAALFDAKNTLVKTPISQKIVDMQIKLAEKELQKATDAMQKGKYEKAISWFAKSWLYSQLALKFSK